ncbi:hypothetical protein BDN70DRAFT_971169 [Pholiota conissans]|uniref:NACHT domain-containing protein n=1 Tax=Pholiota conissans TaxID=109636 RepID=A0A9P5YM93_9AGAR|nr:hypothetical protein BDN70DRAFT_971169 [Pholiota conissans]
MPDFTQSMLSHAHNVQITKSTISTVAGNQINHIHSSSKRHGALHDAAERGDQPGCYENTRVAILKEITDWLQDPYARKKFIYWLYGPAGSGKTSIAQSIAEALAKLGLLAASFFFWRSAAGRDTSDHFVTTIAYQLSRNLSAMADPLYTAIENDPIIFSKSLATQFQLLIINPLKTALQRPLPRETPERIVIIVDGVDECSPTKSQVELLGFLRTAVEEFWSIPFLCLVSSRPEYEIRSTFSDSNPLGALTTKVALDNNYRTNRDIRFYLVSKFNKIRDEHLQLGSKLPTPWPADHDVDCIVRKASGQFIFAATAMKFIDSPRGDPPCPQTRR